MWFWAIVAGVIALMLLLSWRHDRKRRGSLRGDMKHGVDVTKGTSLVKGELGGHAPREGVNINLGPYS